MTLQTDLRRADPPVADAPGRLPPALRRLRVRWALAVVGVVAYAALAAWWTPRGPVTTTQALSAMGLSLLTGVLVGRLVRTRWAIVVAPLLFVAVFELLRLPVSGPTVDGISIGSTYGLMALVLGRGVHGLLALLPMALGAAWGGALARRGTERSPSRRAAAGRWARRTVAVVTAVALVTLAGLVARPASTDPIVDAAGDTVPGSVAELTRVDTGEHELGLMVRGRSTSNPVLLFLAGGPGGTELGAMRRHGQALEEDFVVATLDQRGTGTSYPELEPTQTLTVDSAVDDVLAVTDYLRERFDEQRLYLVGQSWGTLLGVLVAQQRPDAFAAFVGVGQMVSPVDTDRRFYADKLAWARRTGDSALVETLERNGPPPYADVLDYEAALSRELDVHPYDHSVNAEGSGQMSENLLVEEYALLDQLHALAATLDTFAVLYPQLQDLDLRTRATQLEVPVYLAQGAYEAPGRAEPAREWFALLQAPDKQLYDFATSGHRPLWEQPQEFARVMADVRSRTSSR